VAGRIGDSSPVGPLCELELTTTSPRAGAVAPLGAVFGRSGEVGLHELQQFCAAEARGELRAEAPRTCCRRRVKLCAPCEAAERKLRNESALARAHLEAMSSWLPELAALTPAPEAIVPGWRCSADPTCTAPEFGCKTCAANKKGTASVAAQASAPRSRASSPRGHAAMLHDSGRGGKGKGRAAVPGSSRAPLLKVTKAQTAVPGAAPRNV
jgi:hypothetical protein